MEGRCSSLISGNIGLEGINYTVVDGKWRASDWAK